MLNEKDSLIETSLHTLGFLIPVLSITYVALYIKYGEDALIQQTKKLYVETLPTALAQIQESDLEFRSVYSEESNLKSSLRPITIDYNYKEGHIESDFKIGIWAGDFLSYLLIRLEINYRRINFNLYLSKSQVEKICRVEASSIKELNTPDNTKKLLDALGHSLAGAAYAERVIAKKSDDESTDGQSAYQFNSIMIQRELLGTHYLCVVAMKNVTSGFIWDSGERSYFCFDLMLMLRAMIDECPEILTEGESDFVPAAPKKVKYRIYGETLFELCVIFIGLIGFLIANIFNPASIFRFWHPAKLTPTTLMYAGMALIVMSLVCLLGLKLTKINERGRRD